VDGLPKEATATANITREHAIDTSSDPDAPAVHQKTPENAQTDWVKTQSSEKTGDSGSLPLEVVEI
jgi:hypothetical protein